MRKLVEDVEKDKFQAVLVWKISRLSRNMLDTLNLLDKFEYYRVKFISYSENFDTGTPIGRLVVQLMASIAEMELENIEERLTEIETLQDRYMETFEKKTLPTTILQDRLQKVSKEKEELEERKNEIAIQLSSNDSKVIPPELIETLLERFLSTYKKLS